MDGVAVFFDVLLDGVLAFVVVHQVAWNQEALAAFLLDELLGVFCVGLFLGEVDDCYVGPFAGKEDCDCAADAGTVGS